MPRSGSPRNIHRSRSPRNIRRSRSPKRKLEDDVFSISSLSDVSGYDNDYSRSSSKREVEYKSRSREGKYDQRRSKIEYSHYGDDVLKNKTSVEVDEVFKNSEASVDPSVCDFQGLSQFPSNQWTEFENNSSNIKSERGYKGERLTHSDKKSKTHHHRLDKDKRHVFDRLDQGYVSNKREKYQNKSDYEKKSGLTSDQQEGSSCDRINRLEKMVELLVNRKSEVQSPLCSISTQKNDSDLIEGTSSHTNITSIWLNKVNEECLDRQYADSTCIDFVQSKMTGLMKAWFKTLNAFEFTWPELRMLITKTFPDTFDFANTLRLLVERRKLPDETVTQYYFSKMFLIEACKISGANAVSCLIDGLDDPQLQSEAKQCKFLTPETLYSQFFVNIPNFGIKQHPGVSSVEIKDTEVEYYQESERFQKGSKRKKCYNCKKIGHLAEHCYFPPKCHKCRAFGHVIATCPNKN